MTARSILLLGNDTLTLECGKRMLSRGHSVAAVVTRAPAVADWAAQAGLPVHAPGADLATRLGGLSCDWLLSVACLDLIPEDVLALPGLGAVNFHDGPLPRHAGLNAPVWALIEGETRHGIAWHMIEGGIDEGDLLVSRTVEIGPRDTALTLNMKCFEAALDSFGELMTALEGDAPERHPQDLTRRSYHARADRPAGAGLLDPARPAAELERLVRALDHGGYWNPLCLPKIAVDGSVYAVGAAELADGAGDPGAVLRHEGGGAVVAFGAGALRLAGLRSLDGAAVEAAEVLPVGASLDPLPEVPATAWHEPFWRARLAAMVPAALPGAGKRGGKIARLPAPGADAASLAVLALQLTVGGTCTLAWRDATVAQAAETGLASGWVPLDVTNGGTRSELAARIAAAQAEAARRGPVASDLMLRDPALRGSARPALALSEAAGPVPGAALTLETGPEGPRLHVDTGALTLDHARILAARLATLAETPAATVVEDHPRMSGAERQTTLFDWNATETPVPEATMHALFAAQAARTPDATALIYENRRLSYAELDVRANRLAHVLQGMGVVRETVVGLHLRRGPDLLVAALGVLKAGGAYLPLDPAYPADRLAHYLTDSDAPVVITETALRGTLPATDATLLEIDEAPQIDAAPDTAPEDRATADSLAYLIYTSGSTGTPKGVMIEHRNVANFYAGMDAHVPDPGGTWLAVTSLSFDISVLELFYTTARGYTVVLTSDADRGMISNGPLSAGGMDFSLFYWGNDDGVGPDKYKTLIEGAKFADANGFTAVWTPERHFHAFGGPYPNPSVTGAAVAAVTSRIGVRAGSCVAPLHHPARIAEEWAVIDNLTDGRAGLAIASGWQPDDFVLRPENTPPANKPAMLDAIETLRRLWRGEAVEFPRADGTPHAVVTQPRPVSKELPVWVTTAGNPETWREAGRIGANVLTHLLGQSVDEVAEKIGLYHAALREAGHDPRDHTVTLMLHTYLAESREEAREVAREPMKAYLRSAAALIKQYAWAFPAFKKPAGVDNPMQIDLGSLSEDEMEGILDFAFERYFNESGLFGTVADAEARVAGLKRIGVDEIACLIDYGIAPDTVLDGLRPLARVVASANRDAEPAEDDFSIAAQIVRHRVTHLQCTPSMARMIAMNDEARGALGHVRHLFLGGEPLPGALVAEMAALSSAGVTNMYGPTETTIWSAAGPAAAGAGVADLGAPIANTQLYVLDEGRAPLGVGDEGELWIGGAGVARGYWNRPELTAERFVDNPFHPGRMYRTGDRVRRRADGGIDFLGRVDHQVKIRGHRIELGEIEAVLEALPGVTQAVAQVREDRPGDVRLVAYVTGAALSEADLRAALAERLPGIMVPGRIVTLDAFPLTPNKKVDRAALPTPTLPMAAKPVPPSAPRVAPRPSAPRTGTDALRARIAAIWSRLLGVENIGPRDNFFDLGGHSLLAVQAHRAIREETAAETLSITDIFRFPVLDALAGRVADLTGSPGANDDAAPHAAMAGGAADRAAMRGDAMARRRAMRARRRA